MNAVNSSLSLQNFRAEKAAAAVANPSLLGGLSSALPSYDPKKQTPAVAPAVAVHTNKEKKKNAASELTHLSLVMSHPEFKSNPFAAIQQHLNNTLPEGVSHVGDTRHGKKEIVDPFANVQEAPKKRNGSAKRKNKR